MILESDHAAIMAALRLMLLHPFGVFLTMNFITQACTAVAVICLVAGLVLAIRRRMAGGARSGLLSMLGLIGLIAGVLGGVYDGFVTWQAAQALEETRLVVVVPSIVETVAVVVIGIVAWVVAAIGKCGGQAISRRRPLRHPAQGAG